MEQAVIFNQNLLKKGEYYRMSSVIFDDVAIVTCDDITEDILVLTSKDDGMISRLNPEDVLHLGLQFENVTIHPHENEELDIEPAEEEMNYEI